MLEVWKTIEGYTDYQISNYGIVKSMKYNKEKLLKHANNGTGYLFINFKTIKKSNLCYIHRLVAQAFIPNPDNKPQVNHKDGNKQNNRVKNLEWVTHSENMIHSYKTKIRKNYNGNNSPHHKLTENEVLAIHGLYLSGITQYQIGRIYNVNRTCIEHIVNGLNWKDLNKKEK